MVNIRKYLLGFASILLCLTLVACSSKSNDVDEIKDQSQGNSYDTGEIEMDNEYSDDYADDYDDYNKVMHVLAYE